MKIIRFVLKLLFVFMLFMLGVSAADKEYLSQRIMGVQITGCNDPTLVEALYAQLTSEYDGDIDSLCASLQAAGIAGNVQVNTTKRYFEQTIMDDMIIPAGLYDTVCIEIESNIDNSTEFLIASELAKGRFQLTAASPYGKVQYCYVRFLSFLGKGEKILLNLTDVL